MLFSYECVFPWPSLVCAPFSKDSSCGSSVEHVVCPPPHSPELFLLSVDTLGFLFIVSKPHHVTIRRDCEQLTFEKAQLLTHLNASSLPIHSE